MQSYKVIKEEDPQAQVLGLSTAGVDFGFIEKMLAKKTPFDVLTIHPYRTELKDGDFIAELKKASDAVKLPDGRRRPVWITEMGWATHADHHALRQDFQPNSQRTQAEMLARTYLCTITSGVEPRTFWYDFRDDGSDPIYFEHNMGIMRQNDDPKPAYIAFSTLTRVLKHMKFLRVREDWKGVYAGEFESTGGGGKTIIALWSRDSDQTVELLAKQQKATLCNTIGESTLLKSSQGKFRIPLKRTAASYVILE